MAEQAAVETVETKTVQIDPVVVDLNVRIQALAIREADGRYSIIIPALPGCYSAAETIDEIQANVVEAAEGWLASQHDMRKAEALKAATE